ncbi:MAG: hypothetical protein OXC95_14530 [Dehalococcoidia bacterium]|nr:hypothetical protein [Dehalococcoidia bacterium]
MAFGVSSIAFSAAIFIFADIPDIAKYIVGGLPWILVVIIWFQFWIKAKDAPLPASEDYYIAIAELAYENMGQELHAQKIDREEQDYRLENPNPTSEQTRQLQEERRS